MAKTLVIVESPAKAKTIEKFLGKAHYKVDATVGHIRDLPKSRLGIDLENNFEPEYINIRGKGDVIKALKKDAKKAKRVLLATDPDREGEAIAWHLEHILGIEEDEPCRIEFNEITKGKIKNAVKNPRKVDKSLVDAQQARRVLDRLLGYEVSPILWIKVRKGLSAGRVQSVTTKIICDREKEIEDFIPKEYWLLDVDALTKSKDPIKFNFYGKNGKKLEIGYGEMASEIENELKGADLEITAVDTKKRKRTSPFAYTTSMLQQDAVNKLGFTTKKTMMVAQALYEGVDIKGEGTVGLISYIRTDSKRISDEARASALNFIEESYGKCYIGPKKVDKSKSGNKSIQDAHEAIRPTSVYRTPESVKGSLDANQFKLYTLIWNRFVASQMADAEYESVGVSAKCKDYDFKAHGSRLLFDGFMKVFSYNDREDNILPTVEVGDKLNIKKINKEQKFTQPPARFTEAILVKTLEELGIGRPSTYAPTIATILNRGYIKKNGASLVPTELGKVVTAILEENFSILTDIDYTAKMESKLDEIEEGDIEWKSIIKEAYDPLAVAIEEAMKNIEQVNMDEETDEICEECGSNMVVKFGRFGKFLACKNYPECKFTKPYLEKIGIKCPVCGEGDVIVRKTKRGRAFYGCSSYPNCDFVSWNKPTGKKCEHCGTPMVEKNSKKEVKEVCPNKECSFNK